MELSRSKQNLDTFVSSLNPSHRLSVYVCPVCGECIVRFVLSRPSSTYGSVTVRRTKSPRSPLKKLRNLFRYGRDALSTASECCLNVKIEMCLFIYSRLFSLLIRSGSTEVAEEPVYSATTDAVAEFAYDHQSRINHNPLFRNDDEETHESKEGSNAVAIPILQT